MTAPTPETLSLNVGSVLQDLEKGIEAVDTALGLVDKFAAFLPAQFRLPLEALKATLETVDGFLKKL